MSGVAGATWDVVYTTASLPWKAVLNHTFLLDLLAFAAAAVLLGLRGSRAEREQAGAPTGKA